MRKLECIEMGITKVALKVTKANVNSACVWVMHQSKLPKSAKKLQKV